MIVISIYLGGILTLLMALFHSRFYKLFGWKHDFKTLNAANQKILYTIHLALAIIFFIIGLISILHATELSLNSGLAFSFNGGLSLFWLWRFIWQMIYFNNKQKSSRTLIHRIISGWFFILFLSYLLPVINRLL